MVNDPILCCGILKFTREERLYTVFNIYLWFISNFFIFHCSQLLVLALIVVFLVVFGSCFHYLSTKRGEIWRRLQAYKMVTHKEDINPGKFFKFRRERGDPDLHRGYVLDKSRHRLEPRGYTFSQRVVWPFNDLEKNEVNAPSTGTFKKNFDKNEKDFRRQRRADRRGTRTFYNSLYMRLKY